MLVLFLLIGIYVFGIVFNLVLLQQCVKPLFIPVFVFFHFAKCNYINWFLITFFSFSFLGDVTSVFFLNNDVQQYSNLFYFLSYLGLLGLVITKFKGVRFGALLGVSLLVVFLINTYLLWQLCVLLENVITNPTDMLFFNLRTLTLMILAFVSFAVYLNSDSKSSILYLVMALCFIFSEVLFYFRNYYIYDWTLVLIEQLLYGAGLTSLFYYIEIKNEIKKRAIKIRSHNFVFEKHPVKRQLKRLLPFCFCWNQNRNRSSLN